MFKLNMQKEEHLVHDPTHIEIVGDPWLTIQGEGPYVGSPAVFIRTAGCNLSCPYCDSDYTSNRHKITPALLADQVKSLLHYGLVVITGGEPLRQAIIGDLIQRLIDMEYLVQIETNGMLFQESVPWDNVTTVCSPKTRIIHPQLRENIDALKYIVEAGQVDQRDGLPISTLGNTLGVARPWQGCSAEIYVQPMDEDNPARNKENIEAAVQSCLKFGYRLSVQIHKIIGVP